MAITVAAFVVLVALAGELKAVVFLPALSLMLSFFSADASSAAFNFWAVVRSFFGLAASGFLVMAAEGLAKRVLGAAVEPGAVGRREPDALDITERVVRFDLLGIVISFGSVGLFLAAVLI